MNEMEEWGEGSKEREGEERNGKNGKRCEGEEQVHKGRNVEGQEEW